MTVSSVVHAAAPAACCCGNPEQGYRPQPAYSGSKLANLLFGLELQRRASRHGPLTSTVAHPGVSATNLFLSTDGMGANPVIRPAARHWSAGWCSSRRRPGREPTSVRRGGGRARQLQRPAVARRQPRPAGPAAEAGRSRDAALAAPLWDASEELTGVRFRPAVPTPTPASHPARDP